MVVDVYVKPEPTKRGEIECRQCIMTEKVMEQKGVEFNRHILTDETSAKFKDELGFMSAPVVLIHDAEGELIDSWAGFQPLKIGGLLAA